MTGRRRAVRMISFVMLIGVLPPTLPASATKKRAAERELRVAGIMFDFDRKNNWLTVKADGEDEPVKYLIDPENRKLAERLQTVFNASRVRLTYKAESDSRRLVSIQRQVLKESGTVTGVVVKVHNDFWVEVKPKKRRRRCVRSRCQLQRRGFHGETEGVATGRLGHNSIHDRFRAA